MGVFPGSLFAGQACRAGGSHQHIRERLREMNLLDWILIILIGLSTLYGLFRGLIKEVVSLLAVIMGLVGASRFYEEASPLLKNLGLHEQVAKILSFVILFIILFIALVLIGKLLHQFIHAIFLGWLNRLGGTGFGFLRGIIVSGIMILILTITLSEKAPILTESKLTPHIMTISKVLLSLVPENLQRRFMEQEKKLRDSWERKFTT
jgi:membrane protein required for colicin V production